MNDHDLLSPRCSGPLDADSGITGWVDATGKTWMGMALRRRDCGICFGREDSGALVKATAVLPVDDGLGPIA
jgi:hypothetical protein